MCREHVIVATKVTGPGQMPWIRGGPASLSAKDILEALEGSLKRLQTDYIDIYQLHWPDRCVHKPLASKLYCLRYWLGNKKRIAALHPSSARLCCLPHDK